MNSGLLENGISVCFQVNPGAVCLWCKSKVDQVMKQFSSSSSFLAMIGALPPQTSSRQERVTLFRKVWFVDKEQCEREPNQMKVQQLLGFHQPIFTHIFDLHIKTTEWTQKIEKSF